MGSGGPDKSTDVIEHTHWYMNKTSAQAFVKAYIPTVRKRSKADTVANWFIFMHGAFLPMLEWEHKLFNGAVAE